MTEQQIINQLDIYYLGRSDYRIPHVYVFDWESDFFIVQPSRFVYEIEVKISRSDYFADFNKIDKHENLNQGTGFIPNRFYFAVPEGLVSEEEIPAYAGLLYVSESGVEKIKEAPIIKKEKEKQGVWEHRICRKIWYRYIDQRHENRKSRQWIKSEMKRREKRKKTYEKITQKWIDEHSISHEGGNKINVGNGYEITLKKSKSEWSVDICRKYANFFEMKECMSLPDVKYMHELRQIMSVLRSEKTI